MTTILAVQQKDGFIFAADQQVTESERPFVHPDVKKITEVGQYVIGGAGISRYCDIIQFGWEPPQWDGSMDPYTFMVSVFANEMRLKHKETGYRLKADDSFKFIVGFLGELYFISEDYSVIKTDSGIYGIGTGGDLAVGAYAAGASVEEAVKIAIKFDINSGGEPQIVKRGNVNG